MSERKNAVCPEYLLTGIYGIRNKTNNYLYVGSASASFKKRWYTHKSQLNANKHRNSHLQSAWNKYGANSFEFFIIEVVVGTQEEILAVEQFYLDVFYGQPFSYNLSPNSTNGGVPKGTKRSEQVVMKIREAQKARRLRDGTARQPRVKLAVGRPNKTNDFKTIIKHYYDLGYSLRAIASELSDVKYVSIRNALIDMGLDTTRKATIKATKNYLLDRS